MKRRTIVIICFVAILGVLALGVFRLAMFVRPNVDFGCWGKHCHVAADLQGLRTQLALYKKLNETYPSTQQGLAALVVKPSFSPLPSHWYPLLNEVPKDPWQNDYVYRQPGRAQAEFDLFSPGPDHIVDTADDDWGK
jgi:general secretion pathway protein G